MDHQRNIWILQIFKTSYHFNLVKKYVLILLVISLTYRLFRSVLFITHIFENFLSVILLMIYNWTSLSSGNISFCVFNSFIVKFFKISFYGLEYGLLLDISWTFEKKVNSLRSSILCIRSSCYCFKFLPIIGKKKAEISKYNCCFVCFSHWLWFVHILHLPYSASSPSGTQSHLYQAIWYCLTALGFFFTDLLFSFLYKNFLSSNSLILSSACPICWTSLSG